MVYLKFYNPKSAYTPSEKTTISKLKVLKMIINKIILKILTLIILLFLDYCSYGQTNSQFFEGVIKYSTEISVNEFASEGRLKSLKAKYGDTLNIYFSKEGHIFRNYINSGEEGNDFQLYKSNSGYLLVKTKKQILDTLDVRKNSVKLMYKSISNDVIIGKPCECIEYNTIHNSNYFIITYCYSNETPKVNWKNYKKHEDFFLNEYFQISKRPYLKFIVEAKDFKITFTAVYVIQMKLDESLFNK